MYRSKLFDIVLNHRLISLDCADQNVVQMCPELTKFLPKCLLIHAASHSKLNGSLSCAGISMRGTNLIFCLLTPMNKIWTENSSNFQKKSPLEKKRRNCSKIRKGETSKSDLVISLLSEQTQSARSALIERIFLQYHWI